MAENVKSGKKVISLNEFNKRVEIEMANLMYFEYMKEEKALAEARQYVESKFEVQ